MRRDLIALPEDSKVWVYQAGKKITDDVTEQIKEALYNFSMSWVSHGQELDSYGHLFHSQFIVLVADGSNLPSGCSVDSSVHFIQALGNKYNIDFFDRMTFTYMIDEEVHTIHSSKLGQSYKSGLITDETFMFDNLVSDKEHFITEWIKPLNESWHKKFL